MSYQFPIINDINDVLPHIEGAEEFVVAERLGGYKVINYNNMTSDTFRPVSLAEDEADSLTRRIRRECRGIVFGPDGKLVRRPYHKFKNVGEDEENLVENINFARPHVLMEKLDGSMIAPILLGDDTIYWGTKMLAVDFHNIVEEFVNGNENRDNIVLFANNMIENGLTPIFEFCSRQNRVVIDHPEDRLVLTAVRHNRDGSYASYDTLEFIGETYGIEIVQVFDSETDDLQTLVDVTRDVVDSEGIVIRFDDGMMHKVKGDWYVFIHKQKDAIAQEYNVANIILNEKLDDVIPFLIEPDKVRIQKYNDGLWSRILIAMHEGDTIMDTVSSMSRKDWAIQNSGHVVASVIFKNWDEIVDGSFTHDDLFGHFCKLVESKTYNNTSWSKMKSALKLDTLY